MTTTPKVSATLRDIDRLVAQLRAGLADHARFRLLACIEDGEAVPWANHEDVDSALIDAFIDGVESQMPDFGSRDLVSLEGHDDVSAIAVPASDGIAAVVVVDQMVDAAATVLSMHRMAGDIANVRALARERARADEAELMLDMFGTLNMSDQLPLLLSSIARSIARVSGFDRASILVLDRDGRLFPGASEFANGEPDIRLWSLLRTIDGDFPAVRRVLSSGEPEVIERADGGGQVVPSQWVEPIGVRSVALFPLHDQSDRLGVVILDQVDPGGVTRARLRRARRFIDRAASVVSVAKLIQGERSSRRRSQLVLNTVAQAANQLNIPGVLTVIADGVNEVLGDDTTVAFELEGTTPQRIAVAGRGEGVIDLIDALLDGDHFDGGLAPLRSRLRSPLTLTNAELSHPVFGSMGVTRVMVVPIRRAVRHLGWVVSYGSADPATYRDTDLSIVSGLASQAALSLHTAKLLESERAAVARLEDLDRLKNDFVAAISHELRTPLTAIVGFSAILSEQVDDARLKSFIEDIRRESSVLEAMIGNLLDTSRLEAGRLRLNLRPVSLAAVAAEASEVVRHGHPERTIVVDSENAPDGLLVDPQRLRQVLVNLLENAAKYSPEHLPIELHAEMTASAVLVHVDDHGPGIAPEHREVIFQRFHRLGTDEAKPGTGIGLYLVRALVEAHGGSITVSDRPNGSGARFTVRLPVPVSAGGGEAAD